LEHYEGEEEEEEEGGENGGEQEGEQQQCSNYHGRSRTETKKTDIVVRDKRFTDHIEPTAKLLLQFEKKLHDELNFCTNFLLAT